MDAGAILSAITLALLPGFVAFGKAGVEAAAKTGAENAVKDLH